MAQVFDLLMKEVNFRIAWLIRRACAPTVASPICPSSSAFGDEGRDRIEHDDVDRVRLDQRFGDGQRLSPESGWETSSSFMFTPSFRA